MYEAKYNQPVPLWRGTVPSDSIQTIWIFLKHPLAKQNLSTG